MIRTKWSTIRQWASSNDNVTLRVGVTERLFCNKERLQKCLYGTRAVGNKMKIQDDFTHERPKDASGWVRGGNNLTPLETPNDDQTVRLKTEFHLHRPFD